MRAIAAALLVIALSCVALWRTDGFSPSSISGPLEPGRAPLPSEEIVQILSEPYTYLARGRQCFVFESLDGKWVIKFLNYRRFFAPRLPFFKYWAEKRARRFASTFQSLHLAQDQLSEETKIRYLHLAPSDALPRLTLIGQSGYHYEVDLNQTAFILQAKADTSFYEAFQTIGLKAGICAYLDFLQHRCRLNIADDDIDAEINVGFCQSELMLLDPGRLSIDNRLKSPQRAAHEMNIATKRLRKWLAKHHPDEIAFLDEKLREIIEKWGSQ